MKFKLFLAVALSGAFVSSAQADGCADLVTQVDDLLATESAELNEELLGQIMVLRNEGVEACDSGDEEAATESLEHAISLFTQ